MRILEMYLTPGYGRPGRALTEVRGVVIHWTANLDPGADAVANRNYFETNRTEPTSSHYVVDDRHVVACVPEGEVAYHSGAARYKPAATAVLGSYPNATTISIEWCVNQGSNGAETYRNVAALAGEVLAHYGLGMDRLFRHGDLTDKVCPAFFVDDRWARRFGWASAETAWQQFRRDALVCGCGAGMAVAQAARTDR